MSYLERLSYAIVVLGVAGCSGSSSTPGGANDSGADAGRIDAAATPEGGVDASMLVEGGDTSLNTGDAATGSDGASSSDAGPASGTFVFVGTAAFNVLDATNPANLTLAGKLSTGGVVTGIGSAGSYAYATNLAKNDGGVGASTSLLTLNTAVPSSVTEVSSVPLAAPAQGLCPVQLSGTNVFVGETQALEIFDVSNPMSPTHLSSTSLVSIEGFVRGIALSGNYAYLTLFPYGGEAGVSGDIVVVDVTNPASPNVVSTTLVPNSVGFGPSAIAVAGTHAYVSQDSDGLIVFDVSNPASPTVVGSLAFEGPTDMIAVSGDYVYVGEGAKFLAIDVSNPASPTLAASLMAHNSLYSVVVAGTHVYAAGTKSMDPAAGPGTVEVFDVSNPASPSSVGYYDTLPAGTLAALSVIVRP